MVETNKIIMVHLEFRAGSGSRKNWRWIHNLHQSYKAWVRIRSHMKNRIRTRPHMKNRIRTRPHIENRIRTRHPDPYQSFKGSKIQMCTKASTLIEMVKSRVAEPPVHFKVLRFRSSSSRSRSRRYILRFYGSRAPAPGRGVDTL